MKNCLFIFILKDLWIIAAKFEFEVNESIETARSLFQRAIRFVPKNKKLWIEVSFFYI